MSLTIKIDNPGGYSPEWELTPAKAYVYDWWRRQLEATYRARAEEGYYTQDDIEWALKMDIETREPYLADLKAYAAAAQELNAAWEAARRHPPLALLDGLDGKRIDYPKPEWRPLFPPPDAAAGAAGVKAVIAARLAAGDAPGDIARSLVWHSGYSWHAYVVQPAEAGDFPAFSPPARWQSKMPSDATIRKVAGLSREQLAVARQLTWFRPANLVSVCYDRRFGAERVRVLIQAGADAPRVAETPEDLVLADLAQSASTRGKAAPPVWSTRATPLWFDDPGSAPHREWLERTRRDLAARDRRRRADRWRQQDIRNDAMAQLDQELERSGRLPEPPSPCPHRDPHSDEAIQFKAYEDWRDKQALIFRRRATAELKELLTASGRPAPRPPAPPVVAEVRRRLKALAPAADMASRWREIAELLPGFAPKVIYTGGAGEPVEHFELIQLLAQVDWSEAETVSETPWSGKPGAARRSYAWRTRKEWRQREREEKYDGSGLRQRLRLPSGLEVERLVCDPAPLAEWLLAAPAGGARATAPPPPKGKSRRLGPDDYEALPPAERNEMLWRLREEAADRFEEMFRANEGRLPPSPRLAAGAGDEAHAEKEGWWDFVHRHPELVAGLYGGPARAPERDLDRGGPAVPRAWSDMPAGELNRPLTKKELNQMRNFAWQVKRTREERRQEAIKARELEAAQAEAIRSVL